MDVVTSLIAAAGAFAVLSSIGVLLTRDNFYAALYMSVTMLLIAAIYAVYNVQAVVVMIALIFIGAVGIITVAVAASYRSMPSRRVDLLWVAPVIVVFAIVCYAYIKLAKGAVSPIEFGYFSAVPTDYLLVVIFLFSVIILMMLSAIKLARRVEP